MRLSIGDAVYDSDARHLTRCGAEVPLSPKAFRLLELLLERRPAAVSKSDLAEWLWPSTFVTEGNLSVLMSEVRRALGDDPRSARLVRTVRGYGYAFCGVAVSRCQERSASYRLFLGEAEKTLRLGTNTLGRDPESTVRVDLDTVSRHHATIVVAPDGAAIEDAGSKNGTFVNGERVTGRTALVSGALIALGSVTLRFAEAPPLPETRTSDGGTRPRRKEDRHDDDLR